MKNSLALIFVFFCLFTCMAQGSKELLPLMIDSNHPSKIVGEMLDYHYKDGDVLKNPFKAAKMEVDHLLDGILADKIRQLKRSYRIHFGDDKSADSIQACFQNDRFIVEAVGNGDILLLRVSDIGGKSLSGALVPNEAVAALTRELFDHSENFTPEIIKTKGLEKMGIRKDRPKKARNWLDTIRWWCDGKIVVFGGIARLLVENSPRESSPVILNALDDCKTWFKSIAYYDKFNERQRKKVEARQKQLEENDAKVEAEFQRQEAERSGGSTNKVMRTPPK
ncbi:MAG: hypothetical protein PHV34_22780 [Verrucomicrobiae bacterium]|nr:hypothetical protein [Verrucomicrobiae bacterium]